MIEPLIRISYCIIFFVMTLIMGRKWLRWQFILIAFSILYFNKWYNPISFLLIVAVVFKFPRMKKPLFVVYVFAVLICLGLGRRNFAHAVLHYGYCIGIYLICMDIRKSFQSTCCLLLTHDENEIIKQLASGKMKKEVTGYSKNTVTDRVKAAVARNNCSNDGELICRYKDVGAKII